MFRQQGNLLHFEGMLHNSVYFIQNDVYFMILSSAVRIMFFIKRVLKF